MNSAIQKNCVLLDLLYLLVANGDSPYNAVQLQLVLIMSFLYHCFHTVVLLEHSLDCMLNPGYVRTYNKILYSFHYFRLIRG